MRSSDYRQLFLQDTPLLDVRAPVEFTQGHFPRSHNRPLLDDQQRQQIGLRYKQQGQDAAIELGWQLATDAIQTARLKAWGEFCQHHPNALLYCFRGGLRSQLSQQLLAKAGIDIPIVEGGYKAMRRFLLEQLQRACASAALIIIAGPTGSGKTKAIQAIDRAIDLEHRACHRGSVFGATAQPQPAQISFENQISVDWLKLGTQAPVFMEDEGRLIGRLALPQELQTAMAQAPMVVVQEPLEQRVEWVLQDYVDPALGGAQHAAFAAAIQASLGRIKKRLGGLRHRELAAQFEHACQGGERDKFRKPVACLLRDYYDPMYNYQLCQRRGQRLFQGPLGAVIEYCKDKK
ncbi:MAG: tRNA 2-selenouridine(34) synthase MnmH [Cellvibrionaceae bacterium]|nr:tRNA 2-selenouridine(34) synthase MnmH [Cellvibrionaceae bacterium]MCV6627160.1 tRNA 2-selenouridine(34) synthase MnmH [Cellvibrionaceae bacterium]